MRGEIPIVYCRIDTHMGSRYYAEKQLPIMGGIEQSARLLTAGSFERTINPRTDDLLTAYEGKQIQHISIELDNADRYFSRLIAKEPFIGRPISIFLGFDQDSQSEHISLFKGTVTEMNVLPVLILEADER